MNGGHTLVGVDGNPENASALLEEPGFVETTEINDAGADTALDFREALNNYRTVSQANLAQLRTIREGEYAAAKIDKALKQLVAAAFLEWDNFDSVRSVLGAVAQWEPIPQAIACPHCDQGEYYRGLEWGKVEESELEEPPIIFYANYTSPDGDTVCTVMLNTFAMVVNGPVRLQTYPYAFGRLNSERFFSVLLGFVWGISLGDAWVEVEAAEVEEQVAFEALA